MTISVFIATSLDGFIAREDGSLDWLDRAAASLPEGEDAGYGAFIAHVDCLVMGRNTFDKVLEFPDWPYGSMQLVVLSRAPLEIPSALRDRVKVSAKSPDALHSELEADGVQRVCLDGGRVVQAFLARGLVDELILTQVPVLLGSGRPLFGPLTADLPLTLQSVRSLEGGMVQLHYTLDPPRPTQGDTAS